MYSQFIWYSSNFLVILQIFNQQRLREKSDFLSKIIEKLPEVTQPGFAIDIEPFPLGDYFEKDNSATFIFYSGSLTDPPCIEPVTWIISERIFSVSEEQVNFNI